MGDRTAEQVLAEHSRRLMATPGVLGVAEGARADGTPCILVLVEGDAAEVKAKLPPTLEGYPVEFHATGEIEARPEQDD